MTSDWRLQTRRKMIFLVSSHGTTCWCRDESERHLQIYSSKRGEHDTRSTILSHCSPNFGRGGLLFEQIDSFGWPFGPRPFESQAAGLGPLEAAEEAAAGAAKAAFKPPEEKPWVLSLWAWSVSFGWLDFFLLPPHFLAYVEAVLFLPVSVSPVEGAPFGLNIQERIPQFCQF